MSDDPGLSRHRPEASMRQRHPFKVLAIASATYSVAWMALGSLSDWGAYWCSWIVAGFLIPELYGLFVNPGFTLSRSVWALEHLDFGHPFDFAEWTPVHIAVAVVVWGLAVWLSGHFPFAIWK